MTNSTNTTPATIIYILIIIGAFTFFGVIIALVMAYYYQENKHSWLQSHFQFQIRTCFIGTLYIIIGTISYKLIIGYFILLLTFVWLLVRASKGLKQLQHKENIAQPKRWGF